MIEVTEKIQHNPIGISYNAQYQVQYNKCNEHKIQCTVSDTIQHNVVDIRYSVQY